MFVSVIIPTYNNNQELADCLTHLAQQTLSAESFEVIVVDNGSRIPAEATVSRFPFARCVIESTPGSYNARNAGVSCARGDVLAFTDADCRPSLNWLASALEVFKVEPSVTAIGGDIRVTTSNNPTVPELYESIFSLKQEVYVQSLGFAATANLIVRKAVFDEVGHFDGSLLSGGDYDWCRRLEIAGHRLHFSADAFVEHPARASLKSLINKRRRIIGGRRQVDERYPASHGADQISKVYGGSQNIRLLLGTADSSISHFDSMRILLIKLSLGAIARVERLRLALGGLPLR